MVIEIAITPTIPIATAYRLIHEPARLALLTILSRMHADDRADFVYLRKMIGLTEGNLSGHITKLEEGDRTNRDEAVAPATATATAPSST